MLKKVLVSITAAAVLGVAGISVAGAATRSGPAKVTDTTTAPSTGDTTAPNASDTAKACKQRGGKHAGPRSKQRQRRAAVVQAAATAIGVDTATIRAALKAGQSIADVAVAHNISTATVVDALVESATVKIDAQVTAGAITAERASKVKQRLPKLFNKIVNHKRTTPATSPQA